MTRNKTVITITRKNEVKKDDATEKMRFIEENFDVERIRYEDIDLWPFIRVELWFKYAAKSISDDVEIEHSSRIHEIIKRAIGFVNKVRKTSILELFRKAKFVLITDDWERKENKGAIIDKTTSGFSELYGTNISPILIVDEKAKAHAYKRIIHFGLLLFMKKYKKVKFDHNELEGEEVLSEILKELQIEYDIDRTIIRILKSLNYFSGFFRKKGTEALFVVDYYDFNIMCAVYAARIAGIKTVEFQHGTISDYMFPYHAYKKFNFLNVPEYLFCYGDVFKRNASGSIYDYSKIYVVGKYYIDLLRNDKDFLCGIRKKYLYDNQVYITIAGQPNIENQMLELVDSLGKMLPEMMFLYVPRHLNEIRYHKVSKNVFIETDFSIYHCIMISKATITVSSTAGYESLALGTPLLIFDVGGRGKITYESTLKNISSAEYADEICDAKNGILRLIELDKEQVTLDGNLFFAENHMCLLRNACEEILNN